MPTIETITPGTIFILAGIAILYIIYLVVISVIRKKSSKINRKKSIIPNNGNRCKTNQFTADKEYPYQLKSKVLSYNEGKMYRILGEYCNRNYLILLSKIRIADFIDTIYTEDMENDEEYYNKKKYKITSKHVDFLICEPEHFSPLIAIELDDSTHLEKDRQERDEFVDNIYNTVGLPILHFWKIDEEIINNRLNQLLKVEISVR